MTTGSKFMKFAGVVLLCLIALNFAFAGTEHQKKATSKKPQLPPVPTGPTGPIPQMPLDTINPIAPQVSYKNGELTIVAHNSTLADILRAVKKQTGAEIDVPAANDRVVTDLGPGPAREVIADLLNGSRFNYVLLGSPEDPGALTRIVLVAKAGPENAAPAGQMAQQPGQQPAAEEAQADAPVEEAPPEENAEENNVDQAEAETQQQAEQQGDQAAQDQPAGKTPQQMLQEMQQRQLQLQQQQGSQQPGSGMPPHPPQEP